MIVTWLKKLVVTPTSVRKTFVIVMDWFTCEISQTDPEYYLFVFTIQATVSGT